MAIPLKDRQDNLSSHRKTELTIRLLVALSKKVSLHSMLYLKQDEYNKTE